jgi:hypothetical protein
MLQAAVLDVAINGTGCCKGSISDIANRSVLSAIGMSGDNPLGTAPNVDLFSLRTQVRDLANGFL